MKKLAANLTAALIRNEIISPEDQEIYSYGLKLILSSGFTTMVLLGAGIVLQEIKLTLLFIGAFIALRSYVGGYHARSYGTCFIVSCLCYLLCIVGIKIGVQAVPLAYVCMVSIIAHGILFYYGSINSEKNPKTEKEMGKRKLCVRALSSIYCIINLIILFECQQLAKCTWLLTYIQIVCALGIIVEIIKRGK